ncbi:MAG: 30S ribosomal protein S9 [Phycisphaerales bacterium JB052]
MLPDPKPADKHGWWWGTGRRKTAVARVRIRPAKESGKGELKMQISRKQFKSVEEYFSELRDQNDAVAPIKVTDTEGKLDIFVRAHGGGYMGQAQAVRLGLARALVNYDPNFEPALRDAGFLTRDARKVERKKYGQPGARARFQFSKR